MRYTRDVLRRVLLQLIAMAFAGAPSFAAEPQKPHIVVIWGDDIGQSNLSIYTRGLMGYHTPSIDRIARKGMLFTNYYGEQSCTAGRAAFIIGQSGFRTGLLKVGMLGADISLQKADVTIATLLKGQGTPPGSSAKITWAIRTSFCLLTTASTNSTATSIISRPRKSRNIRTIRRIRSFASVSAHAA